MRVRVSTEAELVLSMEEVLAGERTHGPEELRRLMVKEGVSLIREMFAENLEVQVSVMEIPDDRFIVYKFSAVSEYTE